MRPIGYVRRTEDEIHLEILEPYRAGLTQLDHFSHVLVFWWADQLDNEGYGGGLRCRPPYAPEHETGVFATRAEYRPNPIALTTCPILTVDEAEGKVRLVNIDAFDGTPVLDLKAYFPVCDRVKDASIPRWLSYWPEWLPDEGMRLLDDEELEALSEGVIEPA
jgi:tRNA-Thr(GGU) m(6)t(6)A37 methyltransferase TsaA